MRVSPNVGNVGGLILRIGFGLLYSMFVIGTPISNVGNYFDKNPPCKTPCRQQRTHPLFFQRLLTSNPMPHTLNPINFKP